MRRKDLADEEGTSFQCVLIDQSVLELEERILCLGDEHGELEEELHALVFVERTEIRAADSEDAGSTEAA